MKAYKVRIILLISLSLIFLLFGCSTQEQHSTELKSIQELIKNSETPLIIEKATAMKTVGNAVTDTNPTITLLIKNISDTTIDLVNFVIINFDDDGLLCENWMDESGYVEPGGIEPGEAIELQAFSSDPKTSKVMVIIKDMAFKTEVSGFDISKKWTNKNYEAELQTAKNKAK